MRRTSMRCTPTRCASIICTPVRYTPIRHTPIKVCAHEMRDTGNLSFVPKLPYISVMVCLSIIPRARNNPPNTTLAATLSLNALERYADKYLCSGNNCCLCLTCNRQHPAAPWKVITTRHLPSPMLRTYSSTSRRTWNDYQCSP